MHRGGTQEYAQKDTKSNLRALKLWVFISIQSTQDKGFSCLLFTVLLIIISIMSSMILNLHIGLVIFLDTICSHECIGGCSFFYFYCAGMW